MKKVTFNALAIASVFFLNSCSTTQKAAESNDKNQEVQVAKDTKEIVDEGLNISNMDKTVRPQDDLYNFVNGGWMKTATIPSDKANWGSFNQLRETTDENSLKILNKILTSSYAKGSDGSKIQNIYNSFMDTAKRNADGVSPLKPELNAVDQIKDLKSFQTYINKATLTGDNPFYGWGVSAHMKDSRNNAVYLGGPSLGLGKDYYQKNTPENAKVLDEYTKYVSNLLAIIGYKNADVVAKNIVAFEKSMANSLLTNVEGRDANLRYNPKTMADLQKASKNVDLPAYLKNVGVNTDLVIASENKYITNLDQFINTKNLPIIKDYLKYKLIASNAGNLDEKLDQLSFDFYSKYLQGQQEQRSMDKRGLELVNRVMGEAFGKYYVEEYFPAEAKKEMETLVSYVLKSFDMHIKNLSWMSDDTKVKALDKLNKFTVKIAYPDKWRDYSKLEIVAPAEGGTLYSNRQNLSKWAYQRALDKVGKPVDNTEWGMSPQTVNAYYRSSSNEIVFPAAILQPPFFNFKADPAVNFGGIGAVIGHEISHGFDDSGSRFDGDGNLNNWWTDSDRKNFDLKVGQLASQFDAYEVAPDIHVNGKFTSGENIGDLGGAAVAFDAMKMYLKDKGDPGLISGFTQDQRFFMSWATIWRTLATEKYKINQVKTDPHAPGLFRAVGPIINIDAFHEAFQTKPGDKMYKAPNDRIRIW